MGIRASEVTTNAVGDAPTLPARVIEPSSPSDRPDLEAALGKVDCENVNVGHVLLLLQRTSHRSGIIRGRRRGHPPHQFNPAVLDELTEAAFDRVIAVNVKAATFATQAAATLMPQGGSIINQIPYAFPGAPSDS